MVTTITTLTLEEARKKAMLANSYTRFATVMVASWSLPEEDGFRLLGEEWSCCDNLWTWRTDIPLA
jgi:hypothetical protein